jgi:hypothetical protein
MDLVPRDHALADIDTLDDQALYTLAFDIGEASTTSTLTVNYPTMQVGVVAISDKAAALARAGRQVGATRHALRLCVLTEALARAELRQEIRAFAALATKNGRSRAEVQDAGLGSCWPAPRSRAPAPPASVVQRAPKKGYGKTRVIAEDPGPIRHDFVAEQSRDGVTWTQLGTGHGKTRVVTGPSGAELLVRFATVRRGRQSAWSTPLRVIIP